MVSLHNPNPIVVNWRVHRRHQCPFVGCGGAVVGRSVKQGATPLADNINLRSKTGDGRFLSYFDPTTKVSLFFLLNRPRRTAVGSMLCIPPGAVGGTYGSGCFQPFSSFSVSESRVCKMLDYGHGMIPINTTDSLLSGISNMAIRFE